jgi:hypothetical protein
MDYDKMTELELVNHWCETNLIRPQNPFFYLYMQGKGLMNVVGDLPEQKEKAKSVAYARLSQMGKVFGDAEIDAIAGHIAKLEKMKALLVNIKATETDMLEKQLLRMLEETRFINGYFQENEYPKIY